MKFILEPILKILLIAVVVCFIVPIKAQPFIEIENHGLPAIMGGAVKWADFDNDGDLDVIITGDGNFFSPYPSAMTRIYKNMGNNQFVLATQNFIQLNASYAEVLDFNNDNKLDVIVSGLLNNSTEMARLYMNKGNFEFEPVEVQLPQVQLASIAAADINNDGRTDFAMTGYTEYGASAHAGVYINDGNGGFYETNKLPLQPTLLGSMAWGDYNNDQKPDLLQTGYYIDWQLPNPIVYYGAIYTNEGDTFTKLATASIRGITGSTAWGDYNNDGDLDILLAGFIWTGYIMEGYLEVYKNTGSGNFDVYNVANSNIYVPRKARWGDYDNDGDLDIIAFGDSTGGSNQAYTRIYDNNDGVYTLNSTIHLPGIVGGELNFVDYDDDRDLDIYVTGVNYYSMYSKLLRNDNDVVNVPPAPPKDPVSTLSDHDIILQWNKTTDDHSNSNGLSYNIRMGSLCYSNNIVSPLSNISTGWRQVVQIGNTYLDTTWRLNKLTHGWYCWSVQAIDNSFTGSPFSQLAVFSVGIPAATTSEATNIGRYQAAIHGLVNPRSEPAEVFFEYGLDPIPSSKTEPSFVNGDSLLSFTEELGQLLEDTVYYYRIVAQNQTDTIYGGTLNFRTLTYMGPAALTTDASDIDLHSATLHATVNAGSDTTLVNFEFGCDSTLFTPTNSEAIPGGSIQEISCPVYQLLQDTVYYYRVVAGNDVESVLGRILRFRTKTDGIRVNERAGIILFPNPATETIQLMHLKQETSVIIFDCAGNEVYRAIITGKNDSEILDIDQLPPGIYTICLSYGKYKDIRKLVKL